MILDSIPVLQSSGLFEVYLGVVLFGKINLFEVACIYLAPVVIYLCETVRDFNQDNIPR
jgi:hypothetical protein